VHELAISSEGATVAERMPEMHVRYDNLRNTVGELSAMVAHTRRFFDLRDDVASRQKTMIVMQLIGMFRICHWYFT
jgi:hypothetical protein